MGQRYVASASTRPRGEVRQESLSRTASPLQELEPACPGLGSLMGPSPLLDPPREIETGPRAPPIIIPDLRPCGCPLSVHTLNFIRPSISNNKSMPRCLGVGCYRRGAQLRIMGGRHTSKGNLHAGKRGTRQCLSRLYSLGNQYNDL